jgi:hypothetical protein
MLFVLVLAVPHVASAAATPDQKSDLAANAALQYWQAFAQMPTLDKEQEKLLGDWSNVSLDDENVKKLVDSSRASIKYLHRAAEEPRCDWGLDYNDGISLLLPHLAKARDLARLAALHARYEYRHGNKAAFRDDATAIMTLGRHVGRDPILICLLVRYVIEDVAIDLVTLYLPEIKAPYDQAAARYAELPKGATIADTLPIEKKYMARYVILELTRAEMARPGSWRELWIQMLGPDVPEGAKKVASFKQAITMTEELLPVYEQLEKLTGLPKQQFDTQYAALKQKWSSANPLADVLLPALDKVLTKEQRNQARLAMLLAAIAVAEKGPDALKNIKDPFGSGPFEYRKTDGGFELKSELTVEGKPVTLRVGGSMN